ncbi:hypothetical protein D3C71_1305890 [compost metagenome]
MVSDRLQGLLHLRRVGDLGVLPQGIDHARRFGAVRTLAHGKLGRRRGVLQGLVQLHAGTDQGIDHLGHLIARHAGIARGADNCLGQLCFFRLVGNTGLDRNIPNNRTIIRADLGRDGHRHRGRRGLAHAAFQVLLALIELRVSLGFQLGLGRHGAHAGVSLGQIADFNTLFFQATEIGLKPFQQCACSLLTGQVRLAPLITQADGVADGFFQHPGFIAFRLQLLDAPGDILKSVAHRGADRPTNDQTEREFVRHVRALCVVESIEGGSIREPPHHPIKSHGLNLGRREPRLFGQAFSRDLERGCVTRRPLRPGENSRPASGCSP